MRVNSTTSRAERLDLAESPYCVLDSKTSFKMPTFHFEGKYIARLDCNNIGIIFREARHGAALQNSAIKITSKHSVLFHEIIRQSLKHLNSFNSLLMETPHY